MQHKEAVQNQAADRYLLGELSAAEREEFEEHYFSCEACADEVRAGAIFSANVRAVLLEQAEKETLRQPVEFKPGWLGWLRWRPAVATSYAAACLLLMLAGYQAVVVVPGLKSELAVATAPQPLQSFVIHPPTRGDALRLEMDQTLAFAGLRVDLDPQSDYGAYRAEIRDERGAPVFSMTAPAPRQPGYPLEFLVPVSRLPAGTYTMNVHGLAGVSAEGPGTLAGTYRFVVELR